MGSPHKHTRAELRALLERHGAEITRRYQAGESAVRLAEEFDITPNVVYRLSEDGGFSRRPGQGSRVREARELVERAGVDVVRARYEANETLDEIAESLGATRAAVRRAVLRAGGTIRSRGLIAGRHSGEANPSWQGGVLEKDGYLMEWVAPDDPLREPMAHSKGYIPQHRLVMARALGRPLKPHETVHHIDGDRSNNALSNLQLRQGKHGAGVRMACLSCGSHDVAAVSL
jgi:hypothetical protein